MQQDIITTVQEMVEDLTRKQQEVLDFLIQFKRIKKRSPSYTEIAEGVGLSGKQNVYQIVNYLEQKGYIHKGERGNITVIKDFSFETNWLADRIRVLKQLQKDGIINEDDYKRFEETALSRYKKKT